MEYAIKINNTDEVTEKVNDSFFNPKSYWKVALSMSTYIIEYDRVYKTSSDAGADIMDKLESSVLLLQEDGSLVKKHKNYELTDHQSLCAIFASINREV